VECSPEVARLGQRAQELISKRAHPQTRAPKLSAVAVASMTGENFAARLERAITRSGVKIANGDA